MDTIKTFWRETPQPYHEFEVVILNGKVIFKEWWDPGHDPNTEEMSLAEFAGSKVAENIRYHLGDQIYEEVLKNVNLLK